MANTDEMTTNNKKLGTLTMLKDYLNKANRFLEGGEDIIPTSLNLTWQGMDFDIVYKDLPDNKSHLNFKANLGRVPFSVENPEARTQLYKLSSVLLGNGTGRLIIDPRNHTVTYEGWSTTPRFVNARDVVMATSIALLMERNKLYEIKALTVRD